MCQGETSLVSIVLDALTAAGTVGAVVVALFGDRIRARWFPPLLELSIPNPEGHATPVIISFLDSAGNVSTRQEDGRYYHVHVKNSAPGAKATQVQICLIQVDE